MADRWKIEIDAADADRDLLRVAALLTDMRPFWPKVVPLFTAWMSRQFESEGAYGGMPWAKLSPAYAAWKSVHYPGKGILVAEGDLRRASANPTRSAGPLTLELTIKDEKIAYHEEGTPRMPARPLLFGDPLPAAARADLDAAAEDFLSDFLRRL